MRQHEAVLLAMKQNGGYATLGQLDLLQKSFR